MSGRIYKSFQRAWNVYQAPRVRRTVSYGPGPAGPVTRGGKYPVPVRRGSRGKRVMRAITPRRGRVDTQSTFDVTNSYLMPKPAVVVGRPETYLGPIPKAQQGEQTCLSRRYYKMKGTGVSFGDGSDVLYRSGASSVYRDYETHALIASFPNAAACSVLDSRMRRVGFLPYSL